MASNKAVSIQWSIFLTLGLVLLILNVVALILSGILWTIIGICAASIVIIVAVFILKNLEEIDEKKL